MKQIQLCVMLVALLLSNIATYAIQDEKKWAEIYETIANINEPNFPESNYYINDFGAIGDGKTLNTKAINKAIEICSANGGGKVIVPNGVFLTGAIHLQNNVNLHLTENAILKFSTNPADFLPLVHTRWEGNDVMNYSPLIYANGQTNIAVTGKGTLDGSGSNEAWWPWKGKTDYGWKEGTPSQLDKGVGREALDAWEKSETPLFERRAGDGYYLRPQFVSVINCYRFLLEDVKIINAPFWVVNPILTKDVIVRGIHIESLGPNSDGCDPESCKNVLIENCIFDTGDDCIALKSGRNSDGRKPNVPVENVLIRNCKMLEGHGGVVLGSEISAGSINIFAENCEMSSPDLDRAVRIKTNSHRGGIIDGVYIRNIEVGQVKDAVVRINCSYDLGGEGGEGNYLPMVRNVYISNINADMTGKTKAQYGLRLMGIKGKNSVENIFISNCNFKGVEKENDSQYIKNLHLENVLINNKTVNK
ncbi:MAG: glycoside hydrolase family 28 protein [Mangrovibacterium sp.]